MVPGLNLLIWIARSNRQAYKLGMNEISFELSVEEGEWSWLKPHLARGALFLVGPDLSLFDVGNAIANDTSGSVQKWIQKGQLARPSTEQVEKWDAVPTQIFSFLIVQPYVFVQEKVKH